MTQEWYRNFVNEGVDDLEMAFGLLEVGHIMVIRPLIDLMGLRITFVEFGDRSWEEVVSAESTNHALRALFSRLFCFTNSSWRKCAISKLHPPPLELRPPPVWSRRSRRRQLDCLFSQHDERW